MILQALVDYYEALAAQGKITKPGWTNAKISYALQINAEGELKRVIPLKTIEQRGKKKVEVLQNMAVPGGEIRSSGIRAQFLWDNSSYMFGVSNKSNKNTSAEKVAKNKERDCKCFEAMKKLQLDLLAEMQGEYAKAVRNYFLHWQVDQAEENAVIAPFKDDILSGGNLVFQLEGQLNYAQDDAELKKIWDKAHAGSDESIAGQCLVTGKIAPIARLHPLIRGIRGAQSSGASLVSFNARAYESYGHNEDQGLNAPISEYAAYAYGAALSHLIADHNHNNLLSDTTVVYWAADAEPVYEDIFNAAVFSKTETISDNSLHELLNNISRGLMVDFNGIPVKPENRFYVLGIAPNAARLSIRFFWQSSFGEVIKNISQHYEQLKIVKPAYEKWENIPLWVLLQETANKNSKDKAATPILAGAVFRAILSGSNYPLALLQNIILRVKADQDNADKGIKKISWVKAAIIKACLMRNYHNEEVTTVAVNEESKNTAYVLGRLFAVLEGLQEKANPGITATIKDRYFNSACATPNTVFPILMKLATHHLKKLRSERGTAIYFDKQISALTNKIEMNEHPLPAHLSLENQGIFILGYYHQLQKRFEKKEEK